jgi:hypothetical protein
LTSRGIEIRLGATRNLEGIRQQGNSLFARQVFHAALDVTNGPHRELRRFRQHFLGHAGLPPVSANLLPEGRCHHRLAHAVSLLDGILAAQDMTLRVES